MPRFCTNRFKKSFISVMCGRVGLCVISLFFFFSVIFVLSLFLVKKIVISLLPLLFTFYSIENNSEIQPAGCNLIILLNVSIHPASQPASQPAISIERSDPFSGLIRCYFVGAGLSHPRTEDIILFVLQNSLHSTQPHSVIVNYDKDHFVDETRLQTLICTFGDLDSTNSNA